MRPEQATIAIQITAEINGFNSTTQSFAEAVRVMYDTGVGKKNFVPPRFCTDVFSEQIEAE